MRFDLNTFSVKKLWHIYIILQNSIYILSKSVYCQMPSDQNNISAVYARWYFSLFTNKSWGVKGRHMIGKYWLAQWKLGKMHAYPQFSLGRQICLARGQQRPLFARLLLINVWLWVSNANSNRTNWEWCTGWTGNVCFAAGHKNQSNKVIVH